MTRTELTPAELSLLVRVGLLRQVAPHAFELTWAARKLLGEQPPAAKPEPLRAWLARVAPSAAEVKP